MSAGRNHSGRVDRVRGALSPWRIPHPRPSGGVVGWWGQTVRDSMPPHEPDPPASRPQSTPVGASPEDHDAAQIMARTLEGWPHHPVGDDA